MDLNEVRLCGVIDSAIELDRFGAQQDKFNPVTFTLKVGECPIICVADDMLGVALQRRYMRGMRCLVVGRIIARYTTNGVLFNGVECRKVIAEGELGFLDEIRAGMKDPPEELSVVAQD